MFPIAYIFRKWVRRKKFMPLWIWLNSDEPTEIENDYGDDDFRKRKGIVLEGKNWLQLFFISYRWAALRNSHYNLKLLLVPKVGAKTEITIKYHSTTKDVMIVCDRYNLGKQHVTYYIDGWKYFRYSFAKKIKWFGKNKLWNVQLGAADHRWLYKNKISDYEKQTNFRNNRSYWHTCTIPF
jgi:hypothetical protein